MMSHNIFKLSLDMMFELSALEKCVFINENLFEVLTGKFNYFSDLG